MGVLAEKATSPGTAARSFMEIVRASERDTFTRLVVFSYRPSESVLAEHIETQATRYRGIGLIDVRTVDRETIIGVVRT